jgi:hypothetical protein
MIKSKEVTLLLDSMGAEQPVTCVVQYDPEGVDDFADSLLYVIRMDTNRDVIDMLTDEQIESIEYQITTGLSPIGDEDDDTFSDE